MPELVFRIEEPDQPPREVTVTAGMRLGRDPGSDCVFKDQNVSSRHARVVEDNGVLMIEDLGSSNRTRIKGGPVLAKGDRHPLAPGLVFGMGKCRLTVALKEPPKRDIPKTEGVATVSDFARTEAQPIHPYGDKAGQGAEKQRTGSERSTEAASVLTPGSAGADASSESKTEQKPTAAAAAARDTSSEARTEEKPIVEKTAARAAPRGRTSTEPTDAPPTPAAKPAASAPKPAPKEEPKAPPTAVPTTAKTEPERPVVAPEPAAPAAPPAAQKEPPAPPAAVPTTTKTEPERPIAAPAKAAAEDAAPAATEQLSEPVAPTAHETAPTADETVPTAPEATAATPAATPAPVMTEKLSEPEAPLAEEAAPAAAAKAEAPTPAAGETEAPAKPAPAKAAAKAMPELPPMRKGTKEPKDYTLVRYEVDLGTYAVKRREIRCEDLEDVLGGIARGFKILQGYEVADAYDAKAPLVMNLGLLSGTQFMTGLRTFFHGYSPLKASHDDRPSAMWTAGSGKFGTKIRYLGIDEIVFTGRAVKPVYLHITMPEGADRPKFSFKPADHLLGQPANHKIQHLYAKYPEAHFAVIGPAGENYEGVRYAAIALSTINQLRSGDMKSRFCGRGGFGGVMGSKNLLGIVADVKDLQREKVDGLKEMNMIVARGEGSRRFRDKKKGDGGGGTWANMQALDPLNAMPELNFNPTGTETSRGLWRDAVEAKGDFLVKDEACFACGIACHKNIYDNNEGKPGVFRAKFDYEPLNLLSANIGIYDIGQAATLVELVDDLCMDSISIGVTLAYAMEYNKRMKETGESSILPDYLRYGDFEGAKRAIEEIGRGRMPLLGQGSKRLSEALGETGFAMHCKGVEFPAYMPHVNPGYPWALAGGHMSMRTYLLYVFEKEKGLDYWVDAITTRGPMIMRDDVLGVCKFSAMCDEHMATALNAIADLDIKEEELKKVVMRTFLRGYRLEKKQGFDQRDYVMPADALKPQAHMKMEHFNTPDFFERLRTKVTERFEKMLLEEGL